MDEGTGLTAGLRDGLRGVDEPLHDTAEIVGTGDFVSSTAGFQSLRLLETFVVRTKNNRDIPNGSLEGVVDAYAKTATDIGDVGIMVDAAKEAEAVDDEDF